MVHEECIPSSLRGTIGANAGWKFGTDLFEAGSDFSGRGCSGRDVLLLNLLLNEGAADQSIESLLLCISAISIGARIEDRKPHFVFEITLQDDLAIDHRDHTIKSDAVCCSVS